MDTAQRNSAARELLSLLQEEFVPLDLSAIHFSNPTSSKFACAFRRSEWAFESTGTWRPIFRMRSSFPAISVLVCAAVAAICLAQPRTLAPPEFVEWLPVTDAERQLKSPVVEKDAGAEILLWRVHVVDEYLSSNLQRVLYHYIRLKIFNAKASEKTGTVDLPFSDRDGILDVAGRTIKPDGTILELDRKTVYKRDLVRGGGRKVKVVSFAMPGIEDGAILEYRWKQTENDNRFRYLRLEFMRDLPVQKVTYFVKPLSSDYVATDEMYILPFNCNPTPLQRDRDGWTETTVTRLAASREEPYSPSDPNVEPWALLYYRPQGNRDPQKYWNDEAKKTFNEFKGLLKGDSEQKAAAAQAVAGAKNDDEKIVALVSYMRKRVRNVTDPDVTEAERNDFIKKLPKDRERTSTEILKSGMAFSYEMNVVFGALAMQAGLDVRPVLVQNKAEVLIDPRKLAERYFIDDVSMGIKDGDSWRIFDVGHKHLLPGMLPSQQEGMFAIVSDPKAAIFTFTPVAPPEASAEERTAKLKLSSNGSLIGDVEEVYTGHRAEDYRSQMARQSAAQREEWFHDHIVRMFPDAEVTGLKLENVDDASKPLEIVYHIDAPLFAQVTGKRILFHPNAFRRSQGVLFSASERHYPIQFPSAWKEMDDIRIALPDGFDLENADNPGSLDFGGAGGYKLTMTVRKDSTPELVVSREFTFGAKGALNFEAGLYPTIKKVFDQVQLRYTHTLSLRAN